MLFHKSKGIIIVGCSPFGAALANTCLLYTSFKSPDEMAVAAWVRKNRHKAGATTDTLPGARARYTPVSYTHLDVYKRQVCG